MITRLTALAGAVATLGIPLFSSAPAAHAAPAAATAICEDGTYWFGHERAGACDGHDGVAQWLDG